MRNNFQHVPIFLDVSESDNSISWCLQGQHMWELFLCFILIAPLYLQIMHCFVNNFFVPSPDLCTLLVLLNVDVLSPSDFLLAMFEAIVNFLLDSVRVSCLLESKHGGINLLCCSHAYSPPSWRLASLFWFKIWNLCWVELFLMWSSNVDCEWH